MHDRQRSQPHQMRSHSDQYIWEIPESRNEVPPAELPKPLIVTLVEEEDEQDKCVNITRFFPRGRGLFKRPENQQHPSKPHDLPRRPLAKLKRLANFNRSGSLSTIEASKDPKANTAPPIQSPAPRRSTRESRKTANAAQTETSATENKNTDLDTDGTRHRPPALIISIPTSRSSCPPTKKRRSAREIHPWTLNELDPNLIHSYSHTITNIEAILSQYNRRGETLSMFPALQWPITRTTNHKRATRYCLCHSATIGRGPDPNTQRCHDPACAVPGGWYHLSCLSEAEQRDIVTVAGNWICRRCIQRREVEGFPELHSGSLGKDRYALVAQKVLAWRRETVKKGQCGDDDEDGAMLGERRERRKAELVDVRLWQRGLWPMPGDGVLGMYRRWTRAA